MSGSDAQRSDDDVADTEHSCHVCGISPAWFGYDIRGGLTLWFCVEHRGMGDEMTATSEQVRGPDRE